MASEYTAVSKLVLSAVWTCISDTPFTRKNIYFDQVFTSEDDLSDVAASASLSFAPGLLDILQSPSPPLATMDFFKGLPTETSELRWGVYAIVMEKAGHRPILYIGSGTNTLGGVRARLKQYDDGFLLPQYIAKSLEQGFDIVHKGLLCWAPKPPASKVPFQRLLFFGLEATLSYLFWAMKARLGDYGMGHLCRWDRRMLEYDGGCSHCALNEWIPGDFTLSAEQLEALAAEREKKRLALKAENACNYHFKQMEVNYDEYIAESSARVAKSRANNPGRDRKRQADRIQRAESERTFYCERCDIICGTKQRLANHEKTPKHIRKAFESTNPFRCALCNLGYHNQSNLTRHEQSQRHIQNVQKSTMSDSGRLAAPSVKSTTSESDSTALDSTMSESTMSKATVLVSTQLSVPGVQSAQPALLDSTMSKATPSVKWSRLVFDRMMRPQSTKSKVAKSRVTKPISGKLAASGPKSAQSVLDMLMRPKSTTPEEPTTSVSALD